jgi:hypothetical protein
MADEATPHAGEPKPYPLPGKPGIRRDGTAFDTDAFVEAEWTRFTSYGRPIKMAGYRLITDMLTGPGRGILVDAQNNFSHVHVGSPSALEKIEISTVDGSIASSVDDRTPGGLVSDPNNRWCFDLIWDSFGSGASKVLAHAAPNYNAVDSTQNRQLWYGDADGTAALTDTGAPLTSGGVVVLHPYTFVYGNFGLLAWSDAGLPATWGSGAAGRANVTGAKVVKGLPMRGGNDNSPAGLFWSLDSVIRCVANPTGTPVFNFDTVGTDSSIISPDTVVDYDGEFYWMGEDRFYVYNGVMQEVPNTFNKNFVFQNLTYAARMTSFAYTVPRWGEIWFCVPLFGSPVPNWAVIFNKVLRVWYDTPWPDGGRSCAFPPHVFPYPLAMGVDDVGGGKYELWQHEAPTYNKIKGPSPLAIRASYTRPDVAWYADGPTGAWVGIDRNVYLTRFEPDFQQVGDLTITAQFRTRPRSAPVEISQVCTPTTEVLNDLRGQGRLLRWKIESNTRDGFFEEGRPVQYLKPGDRRPVNS